MATHNGPDGRLFIPRKNYQSPNDMVLRTSLEKSGLPKDIIEGLLQHQRTMMKKANADEKLNYEAIETAFNYGGQQVVIINGCLPGILDAYEYPTKVGWAIEIPRGTQLLGVDWTLQVPQNPPSGD